MPADRSLKNLDFWETMASDMLRILQSLKENSTQAIHFLSGRPDDQELEIKRYLSLDTST